MAKQYEIHATAGRPDVGVIESTSVRVDSRLAADAMLLGTAARAAAQFEERTAKSATEITAKIVEITPAGQERGPGA